MTVIENYAPAQYTGDGIDVEFAFGWEIEDAADIRVWIDGVLTTDYSVGVSSITFSVAPANDTNVVIARVTDRLQSSDYSDGNPFPAEVIETDFDKGVLVDQELAAAIQRTIRLPDGDPATGNGLVLPGIGQKTSKLLGFDASENAIMYDTSFIVSAFSTSDVDMVNNYTGLKALAAPVNDDRVIVTALGIEGVFIFDTALSKTEDGLLYFKANDATPGTWRRLFVGPVMASWAECVANGSTDDRTKLQNAAVAAAPFGELVLNPFNPVSNIYQVGDTFHLRQSDFIVTIPPVVMLRCSVATFSGATLAFAEGASYGGSDTALLTNVHVRGGGSVVANWGDVSSVENAIGFSRVQNYSCVGMIVPHADWKGITAQGRCSNGVIKNNRVNYAGKHGISLETVAGIDYINNKNLIADNFIDASDETGISVTDGNASFDSHRTMIVGNDVYATVGIAYGFSGCVDIDVLSNHVQGSGGDGMLYTNCENIKSAGNVVRAASGHCFHFQSSRVSIVSRNDIAVAPVAGKVGFVSENDTASVTLHSPTVTGAAHDYATWQLGTSNYMQIVDDKRLTAGTLGQHNGNRADNLTRSEGYRRAQSITWAANIAPDYELGSFVSVTSASGATTIDIPLNMRPGESLRLRLIPNTFAVLSGDASVRIPAGIDLTAGTITLLEFEYDGGNYRGGIIYTGEAI